MESKEIVIHKGKTLPVKHFESGERWVEGQLIYFGPESMHIEGNYEDGRHFKLAVDPGTVEYVRKDYYCKDGSIIEMA